MKRARAAPTFLLISLLFAVVAECDSELSETLSWMDNTYNSHEHNFSGHGTTGWYAPDNTRRSGEHLASGATETFSYHGVR